jgi:hypothetical protein
MTEQQFQARIKALKVWADAVGSLPPDEILNSVSRFFTTPAKKLKWVIKIVQHSDPQIEEVMNFSNFSSGQPLVYNNQDISGYYNLEWARNIERQNIICQVSQPKNVEGADNNQALSYFYTSSAD